MESTLWYIIPCSVDLLACVAQLSRAERHVHSEFRVRKFEKYETRVHLRALHTTDSPWTVAAHENIAELRAKE